MGQTKNSLKQRCQSHFYYIAHDAKKTEVSRHFNQANHHGINDVEIHVLEFIHDGPHNEMALERRLQTEFDWIHKIRSQIPLGIWINKSYKTPPIFGLRCVTPLTFTTNNNNQEYTIHIIV